MITFKNELPLDHEPSLDHIAQDWANCDVKSGEILSWDHAYESAWISIENEIEGMRK